VTNAAPPAPKVPPASVRTHEFTTQSDADTIEVGRKLAKLLKPPQLLILSGDLGTGKTTLVKGIAQALDAAEADEVTSPTFTLIHEYDGTQNGKPVKLFHLDVYRLEANASLRRSAWTSCSPMMRWCLWSGARSSRASRKRPPAKSRLLRQAATRGRLR
jgi:tRNA threonylcarbamoyl adenosine modification protein YjeE